MVDLLESLWKRTRVVKVLHTLLVETLTPKIFKKNALKNTENQGPTSKKKLPTRRLVLFLFRLVF